MLSKSKILIGEGFTWKTNKGLLQVSWLSPILFNFYINPLLRELEKADSWFRAYADDIVIAVKSLEEINNILGVVLKWLKEYEIELNPEKSGIMRILNKEGKARKIINVANIPEVTKYKYLGIELNQSLSLQGFWNKVKQKTALLVKNCNKIKNSMLTPRSRRILLKTIFF